MIKNFAIIWIVLSVSMWLTGIIWENFDPNNSFAFLLKFLGWVSALLAVGYLSTPSNSRIGKVAFGGVFVTVSGIAMKLLHLPGANALIILGLLVITTTYFALWFGKKFKSRCNCSDQSLLTTLNPLL